MFLNKIDCTSIAPNNKKEHNLNCKTDPITQQHNTINRPLPARKHQRPRVARRLVEKILKGGGREIEQGESVVADVVGVVGPDFPACRLIFWIELIGGDGRVVLGRYWGWAGVDTTFV